MVHIAIMLSNSAFCSCVAIVLRMYFFTKVNEVPCITS